MNTFKVGDFVKHEKNKYIIFQVVQILENVIEGEAQMLICNQVTNVRAYLETDVSKYELTDEDTVDWF